MVSLFLCSGEAVYDSEEVETGDYAKVAPDRKTNNSISITSLFSNLGVFFFSITDSVS